MNFLLGSPILRGLPIVFGRVIDLRESLEFSSLPVFLQGIRENAPKTFRFGTIRKNSMLYTYCIQ